MKTFALFALAMASAAQAIALSPPYPAVNMKLPNTFFGLMALRSASRFHFGAIQANDGELWIGKSPSTYCPGQQGLNCSGVVTNHTTYQISNSILSLGVQVQGGQKIYIDDCGRVGYTAAGDRTLPYGATTTGWSLDKGERLSLLSHKNGTYFCPPPQPSATIDPFADDVPTSTQGPPVPLRTNSPGPWQFYVGVVELPRDCLYAELVAVGSDSKTTAYEYS
ncbi:hypothetical protein Slin15195_G092720 [Septoria linicola]|uniref:Uncharacterized protein n=1 Tax=Septoria linicola TaxID=215465 RepID=A0A9Q9ENY5_9PEZI|nr:hypothetical protein Slin15195_G092720 [Septoria linicola]